MKGYIFVYSCYCVEIETIHLTPKSTPVFNCKYAVYNSKLFIVKKIIHLVTKTLFKQIPFYQLGQTKINRIDDIFKTFKAIKAFYYTINYLHIKNGRSVVYLDNGFKIYSTLFENYKRRISIDYGGISPDSIKIKFNWKKNTTTLYSQSNSVIHKYDAIVTFFNTPTLSIRYKQWYHNHQLRHSLSYSESGMLKEKCFVKNDQKHFSVYQNVLEIPKNLQSLLHLPFGLCNPIIIIF
jgi:hypothetical protein